VGIGWGFTLEPPVPRLVAPQFDRDGPRNSAGIDRVPHLGAPSRGFAAVRLINGGETLELFHPDETGARRCSAKLAAKAAHAADAGMFTLHMVMQCDDGCFDGGEIVAERGPLHDIKDTHGNKDAPLVFGLLRG
jgi:hypothetical protein